MKIFGKVKYFLRVKGIRGNIFGRAKYMLE